MTVTKPFFIMIYTQRGDRAFPMTDNDDEDMPVFFETEADAKRVADNHFLASRVGYEVFTLGDGL